MRKRELRPVGIRHAWILVLLAAAGLASAACGHIPSEDEVKAMMEITDVSTSWVSKEYRVAPNPVLTLVPTISFRVKNISQKPLTYVNFNAVFKRQGEVENMGDNFLAAIRGGPVLPGEKSALITLKSNFGDSGRNLASFPDNPHWKTVNVKLFAQTHGSRPVLLGEWTASKTIDFKEDAPVGMGEQKDRAATAEEKK